MHRNAILFASLLAAGCATGPEPDPNDREVRAERVFITGSNIPKRADAPADSRLPQAMGVRILGRDTLESIQSAGHGAETTAPRPGR